MSPSQARAQPGYDVFISYHWRDHDAVHTVARHLRAAGLHPFVDRWYLVPGQPWQSALEQNLANCRAVAVFLGPGEMGPWQQRERDFAIDRQTRAPRLPVIPVLLPGCEPALGFLGQNTWVDLRHAIEDPAALAILAAAIRGEAPGPDLQDRARQAAAAICPYRGLLHFREEDEPFFFGRQRDADALAEVVRGQNLTAVVGASGAGKSSLVRAGLIPRLRRDRETGWEVVTMVPGGRPLRSLAMAMIPLLEPDKSETDRLAEGAKLAGHLSDHTFGLRDVAERVLHLQQGTAKLLLVVDQWEELYTLSSEAARESFLRQMLEAVEGNVGGLHVVLTLRGDFMGRALEHRGLSDRLEGAVKHLGPMTRAELEQAITGPAGRTGLELEDGLAGRLLDDAAAEPGNLPLLEFVLRRLWEEREGPRLSHAVYGSIGGISGAVARHADAVFARLTGAEQQAARRVFLQVVRPMADGGYTRRRAELAEVG
ncbi:MAG: TIR domain-containing protein, partial [Bryobacteraceae bacterium]|nr:TIR domain-containing protein [Bryobacteraceae bacterium]